MEHLHLGNSVQPKISDLRGFDLILVFSLWDESEVCIYNGIIEFPKVFFTVYALNDFTIICLLF